MENNFLFLRGLMRGNVHWGKDFASLPHSEFIELKGNGSRAHENSFVDPEEALKDLRSQVRRLKQPYHLVAISLGGMLALKWAELFPEEISRLTIVNSSLKQLSSSTERLQPQAYKYFARALLSPSPYLREKHILALTSNFAEEKTIELDQFTEAAKNHPVKFANLIRQLRMANKLVIQKKPHVPMQFLVSEKDRLCLPSCSQKLAAHFNSPLYFHPTAGHDLPLDDAQWLIKKISS